MTVHFHLPQSIHQPVVYFTHVFPNMNSFIPFLFHLLPYSPCICTLLSAMYSSTRPCLLPVLIQASVPTSRPHPCCSFLLSRHPLPCPYPCPNRSFYLRPGPFSFHVPLPLHLHRPPSESVDPFVGVVAVALLLRMHTCFYYGECHS